MLSAYLYRDQTDKQLKLGHYVPIKITNKNCCARLLVHFYQISKQNLPPPWVGKFAWCCRPVLFVGRQSMKNCPLTTLRKLVFVCTSTHLLSRTLNSQLMSREHPDIEILWAVMNGNRLATEGTKTVYEVSEEDPRLLEQFSASMQASIMSWTVDRCIKSLLQHSLLLEEAELRPANPR